MKILFVSQYFYPESFRGNDMVFDLIKKGHNITVLTAKPNYPQGKFYKGYSLFSKKKEFINGAKIIRTPVIPRGNGGGLRLLINYLSFVFFSFFTVHFRIHEKYDLVLVQQLSPVTMALPAIWVKKKQKIPMILWVLDLWPDSVTAASNFNNRTVLNLLNKLVNYVYISSDKILISSKSFKDSIQSRLTDKDKEICYFPNWAEDVFTSNSKEITLETLPKFPEGFNILFAGNMGEAQDFESIAKTIKQTKNINWIFIGDGRKSSWFKEEINKNSLPNVFLYGRFDIELMPFLFKQADAMLVTLKNEPIFELTVPAKIQAYMASSKIILGMLNGEGHDLINNSKSGIAVKAGDYQGLAKAVEQISKMDLADLKILQENSYNTYQTNFSKKTLFDKLEKQLIKSCKEYQLRPQ